MEYFSGNPRAVLVQDGIDILPTDLQIRIAAFEQFLRSRKWRRVAIVVKRVDTIIIALAACQNAVCDILFLRDGISLNQRLPESWQIETLLDDSFETIAILQSDPPEATRAVLLATSGTTGKPKIAMHRLEMLADRAIRNSSHNNSARWLLTYHPASFAGIQVILTAVMGRSELVSLEKPSVTELIQSARVYSPTHISGTPTFWRAFLVNRDTDLPELNLRQITIGGEAVDQATLDQLVVAFPKARISQIYASTEAGALFAVRDGRAGFPASWLETGVEGSKLRIRDGMLEIQSPRAMHGYVDGGSPRIKTQDGWIVSGDLVYVSGDRVHFNGRIDNVINVGGAKVMPEEVEAVLLEHPAVIEVRVFGRRSPIVGAVVCADIVLAEGQKKDEARQAIFSHASRRLQAHKIPRILNVVSSISMNSTGKKVRKA